MIKMINKIVSGIMAFFMSMSGMFYTSFNTVLDSATEMIFGLPYSSQSIKDDFFNSISDSDVEAVSEENGYVKDLIAVYIDNDLSFSEKISLFAELGGVLVGWSTPIDLYVLRYDAMTTYRMVTAKCTQLERKNGVVMAMPVETFFEKNNSSTATWSGL
jgi:hypothetical protein